MSTKCLPDSEIFSCLFRNHVFDGGGGGLVCFQQAVGVDVQGGGCFAVAQAGRNGLCILVTGNQQRGGGMSNSWNSIFNFNCTIS